jgi:propionyl-CoA carboxylase beta chain
MFVEHRCADFGMEKTRRCPATASSPAGARSTAAWSMCSQGLHRVRRLALGARTPEDHQVQDMALKNGAPIIGLFDAGGARIQEGVAALGGYADIFQRNVLASGVIPQISVIMGPVRGRRRLFAGDDRLHLHGEGHELHVRDRPGRGEDRHQRDRDGRRTRRRAVHTTKSGVADGAFENDVETADADAPADRLPAAVEPRAAGRGRASMT